MFEIPLKEEATDIEPVLEWDGKPVDWEKVFPRPFPVEIEIGPGKGEFLLEVAAADREVNLLGVEIRRKRVEKIAKKIGWARTDRVRVLLGDAKVFLRDGVPPESLRQVYVNFPDPWPKRRHAKKRLLQPDMIESIGRGLLPEGLLTVATDVPWYADWMCEGVEASAWFENRFGAGVVLDRLEGYPQTIHEWKFKRQGRPMHFMQFVRK